MNKPHCDIPEVKGACSGITGSVWVALFLLSGAAWTGFYLLFSELVGML